MADLKRKILDQLNDRAVILRRPSRARVLSEVPYSDLPAAVRNLY